MARNKTFIFLSLPLILFFLTLSKKPIHGQGTFNCFIGPSSGSGVCHETSSSCSPGYRADCSIWNQNWDECAGEHTCIPDGLASACVDKLGWQSCPSEFPILCEGKTKCCRAYTDCYALVATPIPGAIGYCDPGTGSGNDGISTAIGCIPINNLSVFVGWTLGKLIFIASGIGFLLMVAGAFQILTSSGNPEKVKAGKELITSALSGLIFIILSLFILKLIGVDILRIPGFAD